MTDSLEFPVLYQTTYRVPFHLADPAGVLFFGNIYAALHEVYERWAHETEMWSEWYSAKNGMGYPIRHSEADYFKFLGCGEEFELKIQCVSLSESTFSLQGEFSKSGIVHARVRTVHTALDIAKKEKAKLTPKMRDFFTKK